jgi:hypothetical protein
MALALATLPFDRFVQWASFMNGYLFLPLGREVTIPLMIAAGFGPAESVGLVVVVDFVAASFIAWNMDLARKMPYFGAFVRRTESSGRKWRVKYPSLHALGVLGLFLWAVKPGRGSGGATSAVLGKLVFVDTWLLLPTILAASVVGCTMVALAADSILKATGASLAIVGPLILAAAGLCYLLLIRREVAGGIARALRRDAAGAGEE